jgi:hypothetical protein
MMDVHSGKDGKQHYVRAARTSNKVAFSCLEYFIDDMSRSGIELLRTDLFETVHQTELSFVYYVTLTLFVTAQSTFEHTIFEYAEEIGTATNTTPHMEDAAVLNQGRTRIAELERRLGEAGFEVRHGRYVEIV